MSAPQITPFSVVPDPLAGRATFDDDMATYITEQNSRISQANTQADFVNEKAGEAADSEGIATAKAAAAAISASEASASAAAAASIATKWVTGADWADGDTAWSPITRQTYRTNSALVESTVDPSADKANWTILGVDPDEVAAGARLFSLWTGA